MKFAIITHAEHKLYNNHIYAYEPYVREMNLWTKHVTKTKILAPLSKENTSVIDSIYDDNNVVYEEVNSFNILSFKNKVLSLVKIPLILYKIFIVMKWADHIHLRCPGNIGLLGCFVQIFFRKKVKTVKYAGNWDPNSEQPFSYKVQKWILSNTFLTKNCKVLVYGEWDNQSKNIKSFFTASYAKKDIEVIPNKNLDGKVKFIYVGGFTKGKQPLKSIKIVEELYKKGYDVELNMFGNGQEYNRAKKYVATKMIDDIILIHGNKSKEIVKKAFQESHFLMFISKSEGWPKVVAEAMFWSCLPISTKVSCIPFMLDNGTRGSVVTENVEEIQQEVIRYFKNKEAYRIAIEKAREWSQGFTLDSFEKAIKEII